MTEENNFTEKETEIYLKIAPIEYEKRLGIAMKSREISQSYGIWFLTSLLAMNSAAIIGIASSGLHARQLFIISGLFFIVGLAAALVSGLCAWLNWEKLAELTIDLAEPNMICSPEYLFEPLPETKKNIKRTKLLSTSFGVISGFALVSGGCAIWLSLTGY